MNEKDMANGLASEAVKQGKRQLLVAILTNPYIMVPLVILTAALIAYIIYSADVQTTALMEQYQSLSAKHNDSKAEFDKRLHYITVNNDGTVTFTVGYRSEVQKQQMEGEDPNGGGGDTWDGDGLALNAMDMYSKVSYTGVGSKVGSININGVNLYTGIPWADDGNWYQLDTSSVSSYLSKNLGKPLQGGSAFHTDNNNSSSPRNMAGVNCAGISWTPIFCFLNVNDDGSFSASYDRALCNKFYGVVILSKDGKKYYLPICSGGDNKGHTFPGGMVQTYIGNSTRLNMSSGVIKIDSSNNATDQAKITWNGQRAHGMEISFSTFKSSWATAVKYGNGGMGSHPQLTIETHSNFKNALDGFSIDGFIIHKN